MLFIQIPQQWENGMNIIKYRNVYEYDSNNDGGKIFYSKNDIYERKIDYSGEWYYMYIDIETLNLLVQNFGIISTTRRPTGFTNCDNPSTGTEVHLKYCGANINLVCKNKTRFNLNHLEQDW